MRTIAATFDDRRAAEAARARLERAVDAEEIEVAPAVVAASVDGPIDQPCTLLVVTVPGGTDDVPTARDVLMDAGGHLVADIEAGM